MTTQPSRGSSRDNWRARRRARPEPPDLSLPPYSDPRVIVTPHAGFLSAESLENLRTRTARQVAMCLQGGAGKRRQSGSRWTARLTISPLDKFRFDALHYSAAYPSANSRHCFRGRGPKSGSVVDMHLTIIGFRAVKIAAVLQGILNASARCARP